MILTTTPTLEGHPIREYRGVVTGETIIGANAIKDFMAGMRDFFGGRSKSYESVLREAKDTAMREMAERAQQMGCNAVVGIDIDYETVGQSGSMLMVTCSGTGVVLWGSTDSPYPVRRRGVGTPSGLLDNLLTVGDHDAMVVGADSLAAEIVARLGVVLLCATCGGD